MALKRMSDILIILCAAALQVNVAEAASCPRSAEDLAEELYGKNSGYEKMTSPGAAVAVKMAKAGDVNATAATDQFYFNMQFNAILEVHAKNRAFAIDVWTREVWHDWRLTFNTTNINSCLKVGTWNESVGQYPVKWVLFPLHELEQNLWRPMIWYQTLLETPKTLWSGAWLRSDGHVWITKRQILIFSCKMDFTNMPFDKQDCVVPVQSADPVNNRLIPGILGNNPLRLTPPDGVFLGSAPSWSLDMKKSSAAEACEFMGDTSSQCSHFIKYVFVLVRSSVYYEHYHLLPMYICIGMSWASFFISRQIAPARIALTTISLLTLLNRVNSLLDRLPDFSGSVWLLDLLTVSSFFCFYANVEYALAHYLLRVEHRVEKHVAALLKDQHDIEEAAGQPQDAPFVPIAHSEANVHDADGRFKPRRCRCMMCQGGAVESSSQMKIQKKLGLCDRLFVSSSGDLRIKYEYLDICSRWLFPIVYIIVLVAFYAKVKTHV